ncbi:MAG TPA: hypothetical protein DIU15_13955 [Deltaproteobacteria bacterium]|nr:hypothetical protein [Deltaproteobacteria bacterium]HCP47142.1 hypothetical protein [Deltaproteobacteria bacterium]
MLRLIAVAPQGLEREASRELRSLGGGIGKTQYRNGRIHFEGPPDAIYRCNLHLRSAERILVELGHGPARTADSLRQLIADLPWDLWVPRGKRVRVFTSTRGCRLYHTGAIEDVVLSALSLRGLGGPTAEGREEAEAGEEPAPITVDLRGTRDEWSIALDTSGRELHRRGYRIQGGKAPIRETIAAALLRLAGWSGERDLLDPMCGSGTFLAEAAWIAQQRASGLARSFAFEHLSNFDASRWAELRAKALGIVDEEAGGVVISGSDQSKPAVRAAQSNIKRAGLESRVAVTRSPLEDVATADASSGLVVLNPPYDRRLRSSSSKSDDALETWRRWGQVIRERRSGWDVLVLAPDPARVEAFGGSARRLARFSHGGLRVGAWLIHTL